MFLTFDLLNILLPNIVYFIKRFGYIEADAHIFNSLVFSFWYTFLFTFLSPDIKKLIVFSLNDKFWNETKLKIKDFSSGSSLNIYRWWNNTNIKLKLQIKENTFEKN